MAEQAEKSGNSGTLTVMIIVLAALFGVIFLIIGIGTSSGNSANPNTSGATVGRPINPTDAKDKAMIDTLIQAAKPDVALKNLKGSLATIKTNIDLLSDSVKKSTTLTADQQTKIQGLYDHIKNTISSIEATNPSGQTLNTQLASISQDAEAIKVTLTDTSTVHGQDRINAVIALGKKFADENRAAGNGNKKYPYVVDAAGPTSFDNSGFMTYLLAQNKVIHDRLKTATVDNWLDFSKIDHSMTPTNLTADTLKQAADGNTLQPGDLMVGFSSTLPGQVVMYIGPSNSNDAFILSAGTAAGGPQYATFTQVAAHMRSNVDRILIMRPNY